MVKNFFDLKTLFLGNFKRNFPNLRQIVCVQLILTCAVLLKLLYGQKMQRAEGERKKIGIFSIIVEPE